MSGRRIPFYGEKLTKPPLDLATLPEPEAKPNPIGGISRSFRGNPSKHHARAHEHGRQPAPRHFRSTLGTGRADCGREACGNAARPKAAEARESMRAAVYARVSTVGNNKKIVEILWDSRE